MPSNIDHPVGYGNPPLHTRFKPGESGNKNGRPKKRKPSVTESVSYRLLDLFGSKMEVPNPDQTVSKVTILEACVQKCLHRVLQTGDIRAFEKLMEIAHEHEEKTGTAPPRYIVVYGGTAAIDESKRKK